MTPENFVYWLQGYSEIDGKCPTEEEWLVIQDHLALVFSKQTPYREKEPLCNMPEDPFLTTSTWHPTSERFFCAPSPYQHDLTATPITC